jgi:hypothetical protein
MWRRITNSDMLFRFVTADPMRAAGLILPDERANLNKPAERKAFYMVNRGDAKEDGEDSAILIPFPEVRRRFEMPVTFDRRELDQILRIYGRMVAAGEWRDYAIDHLSDRAVFSVFRRTSEVPLFQIAKMPKLARRQGAFAVIAAGGLILKRGHELARVLGVFDRTLKLAKA